MSKGGSHLSNEQDIFSFDLNESLYFQKGQEVSQMLSISLEPEISIQSFNEYVSIRGVIELHGEYEKSELNHESDEQVFDLNDHQSRRYFEKIINEEDSLATFSHRFPVEISVPSYRVDDINDIKVSIESFDYEIPEEDQLNLISTIEIHGISNETILPNEINERIEQEATEGAVEIPEETFQFELKEELIHASEEEAEVVERVSKSEEVELETTVSEEVIDDKDRWKYKQSQSLEEFFKVDDSEETEEVIDPEDHEYVSSDIDMQEDVETDSDPERKRSYLANFFGDDESEEEEKYEQMRICIVQDQDTLESISERYQIPKLQLLKSNRLADDDLTKGQLLTIPSK